MKADRYIIIALATQRLARNKESQVTKEPVKCPVCGCEVVCYVAASGRTRLIAAHTDPHDGTLCPGSGESPSTQPSTGDQR